MDASVILCVRNGAATIEEQLIALEGQSFTRPWELVLVDNGSTDATAAIAEAWRERLPLRIVPANERAGLAYARNVGAAAAAGRVLAFCDADDVADPGWLRALTDAAQESELVGGRLDLSLLNTDRARYWRNMSEEELTEPRALGYLRYAVGANFAIRKETFAAVGGCDEAFSICSDDIDLSWRVQRDGGTLSFSKNAVMNYRLRGDLRGLRRQLHSYGLAEGRLRRKFPDVPPVRWENRWPVYRHLLTRSWHLVAEPKRRGHWLATASYCAGRIHGALRYRVPSY